MNRTELRSYLDQLLAPWQVRDYCPNGLQVEGRERIERVVCGVTASRALIEAAVASRADAILVHHGYFWRGEDSCITGMRRQRLGLLMAHDINLFAYHLPLDVHPELGNNAQLGARLGWVADARFADQGVGFIGAPAVVATADEIAQTLAVQLGRTPLLVGDGDRTVRRVAWCTGGAQGYFEQAIAAGADVYVSGEISEQTAHIARESGVPYIAAGHHATERYGVAALGRHLAERFGLDCEFIDIDNPA
jgi:dinuclear metal center YbgI/SA1388 family protein